jgi:hypothetical protein
MVRLTFPRRTPCRPQLFHQSLDRATRHRDALTIERQPYLARRRTHFFGGSLTPTKSVP